MTNGYRRIYYDKTTGLKIAEFAFSDNFIPMTVDQEIASFTALSERNRETFDVLELPFGAYSQDFREAALIGVDLEKKIPLFAYPNPSEPENPVVPDKPLTEQIKDLENENILLKAQTKALTDKTDFHEDLIAEMAMLVYS